MSDFKKEDNLMSGKGEDDIDWITVNGNHIPIKDGENPKEAVENHFANKKESLDKKHSKEYIGTIDTGLYEKIIGKPILNKNIVVPSDNITHIDKRHEGVYERHKKNLPQIINDPDYVLQGQTENRLLIVKRIDKNVEVVLELSLLNKYYSNKMVSMWELSDRRINNLIRNNSVLYKKRDSD